MAEHDAKAFVEIIAQDAVFDVGGPNPVRGREAIVESWRDILSGAGSIRPRWYPARVVVAESGAVAWSTGPVLIEERENAGVRNRIGIFRSVWRKEPDGAWRVLSDDGGHPERAAPKEVEAFERDRADCAAGVSSRTSMAP